MANITENVVKSITDLEKILTSRIRKDAVTAGWPKRVADSISVKVTKDEILAEYPENLTDTIMDLEYGNQNASPKPVLRRFVVNNQGLLADAVAESSLEYLFDEDLLP